MKDATQATHRALATDYDRKAILAATRHASAAYRRLAREHRLSALTAAYRIETR